MTKESGSAPPAAGAGLEAASSEPVIFAEPVSSGEGQIAAIVLAAGGSRRLGHPKQLIQYEGESLLRRTVRLALGAGCQPVVVVLGSHSNLLLPELQGLAVEVAFNARWESGMASSIQAGIGALTPHTPESIMMLVCDQPLLTAETLTSLLRTHRDLGAEGSPDITASTYAGVIGVPAIFSPAIVPDLMALSGDEGARKIISNARWRVATVEFAGGAADIDLPSDLARLSAGDGPPATGKPQP